MTFLILISVASIAHAQNPGRVVLGTADSFAVLAGTTVTNTGPTVVTGDLGVSPGNAVTGFPPGVVQSGTIHAGDAVAAQAQQDLAAAYNDAAGRACNTVLTGQDLGGLTLTQGVYCFASTAQLTGTLTLDAQGNPDAVFIFQIGSALTTASGSRINLINGAQACNVFWQVGSSATLGTTTQFAGTIMALTSITANTDANILGRALARNGATTLDSNDITRQSCAAAQPTPTPTPAGTTPAPTQSATPPGSSPSPGASPAPGGTTPPPGASPGPASPSPGSSPPPSASPTPGPTTEPQPSPSPGGTVLPSPSASPTVAPTQAPGPTPSPSSTTVIPAPDDGDGGGGGNDGGGGGGLPDENDGVTPQLPVTGSSRALEAALVISLELMLLGFYFDRRGEMLNRRARARHGRSRRAF
ncbi:MAG TPA: ice-binding family protein [Actinomycetota bacterium]|nr:ice-binding family protein [Actinomycetota bacterium]